jgi:hypothetical protein
MQHGSASWPGTGQRRGAGRQGRGQAGQVFVGSSCLVNEYAIENACSRVGDVLDPPKIPV